MTICTFILTPIVTIVHLMVWMARYVTELVCGWVTTTIKVIKEIVSRVCGWLPWPFNKLCDWVTDLIEIFETVTEWVCEKVLKKIIDWVEIAFEYVFFLMKWICWLIDWLTFRWIALASCSSGIELNKCLPVCITILADDNGRQTISVADAQQRVASSTALLQQCRIRLVPGEIRVVRKADLITNVATGADSFFGGSFAWFSRNVCDCCNGVTIYFISSLSDGSRGYSIPGCNWILVAVDSLVDDATIVHEIGHLSDLWTHDDDPENVMSIYKSVARTKLRSLQCCLIGTARFTRVCGHE